MLKKKPVCFCNFNVILKSNKIAIDFHLNFHSYSGGKFIMIARLVLYSLLFSICIFKGVT